jgi:serine/threonine-protein kinase RsbT
VPTEKRILIETDADIVTSRQEGRELASTLGFSASDLTVIAAAISEVARNIYAYARRGEIRLSVAERNGRRGIKVVAADQGPGIADAELAMQDASAPARLLARWHGQKREPHGSWWRSSRRAPRFRGRLAGRRSWTTW